MAKKYTYSEEQPQMASEPATAYSINTVPVFTGYQMQILDCIANVKDDNEMKEIRNILADYFSNKALDAMDKLCDEGKLSDQIIESWHKEHLRTPYKH